MFAFPISFPTEMCDVLLLKFADHVRNQTELVLLRNNLLLLDFLVGHLLGRLSQAKPNYSEI